MTARRPYPGTHAEEKPDAPAVIFAPTGEVTTWRDLEVRSNRIAHLLRSLGLRRGDHVAVISENHPAVFEIMWAALRSGLYYTPVSSRLTVLEAAEILRACRARVVFASGHGTELADSAAGLAPQVGHRLSLGLNPPEGWSPLADVVRDQPSFRLAEEPEGAPLWFSSGTSGRPKAVVRPLPDSPGDPIAMQYAASFGIDADTVHLCLGPLHHAAPIGYSTIVHRVGGSVVLTDRFDPEQALSLIERYRVTFSHMVPTMFVRFLKLPPRVRAAYDLSSLRKVIHGAAPCPEEVKRAVIDWWGPIVDEYYGGTEGVGSTTITSAEWLDHPGSVGRAKRGVIHIVDEAGVEVPLGREGMIYFENPTAVTQYLDDPEQTAAISHPEGWQTLGDIGRLDDEGYLYLTDRWTHKIISGGVNVFPREVEDILLSHPAVLDAAVIGVPDDDMGEAVRAVVELLDPLMGGPDLERELVAYCRDRLAYFKCPRAVDFAPLPRQDNGKLYKRLLRERYWAGYSRRI